MSYINSDMLLNEYSISSQYPQIHQNVLMHIQQQHYINIFDNNTISRCENSSNEEDNDEDDEDDEDKRTIFCANVDERVTEELLYELFIQAGPIERLHVPKDKNGKYRPFGFITYTHRASIPYALKLFKGVSLFRKQLAIKANDYSEDTPKRNNSALRGPIYDAFMHDNSPQSQYINNSFRQYGSPDQFMDPQNQSGRNSNDLSKRISPKMRSHNNDSPYNRQHRNRLTGNQDSRNSRQYNGSDRRSEQRRNRRP